MRKVAEEAMRKAREEMALDPEKAKEACTKFSDLDLKHGKLLAMVTRVKTELIRLKQEEALLRASVEAEDAASEAAALLERLGIGDEYPAPGAAS